MGEICNTHGRVEKCVPYLSENLKRREHFGELRVDRRIILG
jgi:hypothetical protein